MNKREVFGVEKQAKEYLGIVLGALLISMGLYFFWMPSELAAGGVSGLAIVIKALLPKIPIGFIILCLDIVMFTIGFMVLGKSFGVRSIVCSFSVSILMMLLEYIFPNVGIISKDTLIILIFGTFFIAAGQALVFNLEASSGGTDIIAKIITKYSGLNIGVALLIADLTVVVLAIGIFGIEKGLYAALGVVINSTLIDYIIEGLNVQKYLMVIPSNEEKGQAINMYILEKLERGVTIYRAEGGYSGSSKMVITTVVDRREFVALKKQIIALDEMSFVTIQNLHEVVGEGFKS